MTEFTLDKLCNEVLTAIEIQEAQLLNWGFVNVSSDLERELSQILEKLPPDAHSLWEKAKQLGVTPTDILTNLSERLLIFKGQNGYYRTRFAETVRLLYLLRQRFSPDDWQTASRLVSDMRLQLRRRRYPAYVVPLSNLFVELKADKDLQLSKLQIQSIEHLLQQPDGAHLNLAHFQEEAILQQLRDLQQRRDRALVIGAGTGAGKTKAFYVPALTHIVEEIDSQNFSTKAIAIYPRVELLKDQLAETYSETRKLDSLLVSNNKRSITLGAYYGDTPRDAKHLLAEYRPRGWEQTRDRTGWICPYFSCPNGDNHRLVWEERDVQQESSVNEQERYGKYARLRCQTCNFETHSGQLLLTREQMIRTPPDILFTTTEMLNRRLSRPREHALFGVDTPSPPQLVLLDEIHTYEGLTGAQVAHLLRRWRHARDWKDQDSLCIVGLSATLTQAESFFSKLTGIPEYEVNYIHPLDENLVEEGVEYNLVLKGDPVSGTSLLSTSVQSAMLLGRILDSDHNPISRGAYGQRVFAFTDKLDVINRWYHIQYDAEKIKTLSQFRDVDSALDHDAQRKRYEAGQDWRVCKLLGHDLQTPLRLERTTSQDRGVSANADLVIATSTLEVGFNDPRVGAIIQHKAPRSLASFLQRKGRAGRRRRMRPWMVVVTSAYGRDRWAFQHAENLFDPLLPPIDLPIENYYVRKIHAAFAMMDWLSLTLKSQDPTIDIWRLLSNDQGRSGTYLNCQRHLVCNLLQQVLDGTRTQELENYIKEALGIGDRDTTILSIMWGEPRSLLFDVIPTLLRQLETNWQIVQNGKVLRWGDYIARAPMPEHVTSTLFGNLSLLEVKLMIPSSNGEDDTNHEPREEFMGLAQALTEFAPGRVSKRFASRYAINEAHWLALPEDAQISRNAMSLEYLDVSWDDMPKHVALGDQTVAVYRPRTYNLDLVPTDVRSTSYAQLLWRSHFEPKSQHTAPVAGSSTHADGNKAQLEGSRLPLTYASPWHRLFKKIEAFTHVNGTWLEVTRLAVGVDVDTRYKGGKSKRRTLFFEDPTTIDQQAAIGFDLNVDALRCTFKPLNTSALVNSTKWTELYTHFAPTYFLYKLNRDRRLTEAGLSSFEVEWLWQLHLSMLLAVAISKQTSLPAAADEVKRNRRALADRTLRAIFQSQSVDQGDDEEEAGRLHQKLLDYLDQLPVQDALSDAQIVLWDDGDEGLQQWLEDCYASSLGALTFAAVTRMVPDIEPDDLVMDLDEHTIWISEVEAGGVGLVAKIADAIAQRPRDFELQLMDALKYCEREQLAINLRTIAALIARGDEGLEQAFQQARSHSDLLSLRRTHELLVSSLQSHGIPATRALIVALNTKFLRPNSGPDSDELITTLVRHWEEEQQRLACAIDLRIMSVAALRIDEVETKVQELLSRIGSEQTSMGESQIFNLLQSLLWLDCTGSCPDCIESWQPYQDQVHPSRALLLAVLNPYSESVQYGEDTWQMKIRQLLADRYQVQLACSQSQLSDCKGALMDLLVTPIDIGFQSFFPIVERVDRVGDQWVIQLIVHELLSGSGE